MDVLQAEIGKEPPWVMLFADDLVSCVLSRAEVELLLARWRDTFQSALNLRLSSGAPVVLDHIPLIVLRS